MAKDTVILAYSGGLDTSVCLKWLQEEKGLDVVALVGEVGQEHDGLEKTREKALELGVLDCLIVDMREEFANNYLSRTLMANGLYENAYPLLSALSRPLISEHLVRVAHEYGAKYVAHGCTGKGNDQVRFEASVRMLDPELEIIAPVREWDLLTRPQEIDWAREHGVPVPVSLEKPYSIDDNLWGRAIECGVLEDPWNEPPADIYAMTVDPAKAPDEACVVEIDFKDGIPCGIDGEQKSFLDVIYALNAIAGAHGYGRLDMIENRLVGVKSRECYEVPAGLALITAHKALETMCLEREVLHYKLGVEQAWATAVYNGLWFSPLKRALDAFIENTQKNLSGTVRLSFFKGTCTVTGMKSPYSLYDKGLATYDEGDTFDRDSAKGFIDLFTLQSRTWASVHRGA